MAVFTDCSFAAEFFPVGEGCGDAEVGCIIDGSHEFKVCDVG